MADQLKLELSEDGKEILKKVPLSGLRKAIAVNMENSYKSITHTSSFVRADMSELLKLKDEFAKAGHKVSITAFMVKIAAIALQASPYMNASINGKYIELYKSINIAVGIATKDELLVAPVIRSVENKNVLEISTDLKDLVARTNEGKLQAEDFEGATFTISNLGMYEICGFTALVSAPQVGVLGIGSTKKEPVVDEDGNIVVRPMAYISTSKDHRVVLGIHSVTFYQKLLECIKKPSQYISL